MPNKKTKTDKYGVLFLCYQAHGNIDNNWLLMEMMVINVQYVFFVSV